MKRFVVGVVGLSFCLFTAGALIAQDKSTLVKSEYFPLELNTVWEYKTTSGKAETSSKITTTVVKHEEIGGVMCARLEARLANKKTSSEYVRVTDKGVYRHQASEQGISPPLLFLKLPFKEGDKWDVESKTLGLAVKGTFTVSRGAVKVPAGEYKDVIICRSNNFKIADKEISLTYWFAKGVGIVKQEVKFGGEEMVLELEKFTPPNN